MAKKTRVTGARTRTTYDSAARAGAKKNMARMRRSSSKSNRAMGGEGKDSGYAERVDQRLRAGERTVHVQNRSMYHDDKSMPGKGKSQMGFMPSKTVTGLKTNKRGSKKLKTPQMGRDIPLPPTK